MGRQILVTGGTGFIGSHLIRGLVENGDAVHVLARSPEAAVRLRLAGILHRVRLVPADLADSAQVKGAYRSVGPEVVYHLAAHGVHAASSDLRLALDVNVLGAVHLLEACRESRPQRVIWVGSALEYAYAGARRAAEDAPLLPGTLYGASKTAGWIMARYLAMESNTPLVTIRPFASYGPMERMAKLVPYLISCGLQGKPVMLTNGDQVRDYLYVGDLVRALMRAATVPGIAGQTYNLGAGSGVRVTDLAKMVMGILGCRNLLGSDARSPDRPKPPRVVADIRAAVRDLDWRPETPLLKGLSDTVAWYRAHRSDWGLLS